MNKQPKFINIKLQELDRLRKRNEDLRIQESTAVFNELITQEELNVISEEIDLNNRKIQMLQQELSNYAGAMLNKEVTNDDK